MNPDAAALPPKVRLSQTRLWDFQKEFYTREGADAWARKIPFFSTSNAFIARSYADILFRFMQDWTRRGGTDDAEPFYVLELGSGTGAFGFYLLRHLLELRARLDLPEISFVYVMSDFVEKNLDFIKGHPALGAFVEAGLLGFARFEIGVDERVEIELGGVAGARILGAREPTAKPLVVIANYVFDSLPCDAFVISEGILKEGLTRPDIKPNASPEMNTGAPMEVAGFDFTYADAPAPCYTDERYEAVLSGYRETFREANFLFPVGALDCLKGLEGMCGGEMFVLATDKGYGSNHELYMTQGPDIVLHNAAFSVTVNFHALGEYARLNGGSCYHQSAQGQISMSVFAFGFDLGALGETANSVAHHVDVAGPSHLFNLYTSFERVKEGCTEEELVSYLNVLGWDPYVVNGCVELLASRVGQLSPAGVNSLSEGLRRAASLFYQLPGAPSVLHNVGTFLQSAGDYEGALHYYRLSTEQFGQQDVTRYNMGLCHFFLGDFDAALEEFGEALARGYPDTILLKGWLAQTREELAAVKLRPA